MAVKFDLALLPEAPDLCFEQPLWGAGIEWVAGIDEAGRGALAGPVAAASVVLPPDPEMIRTLHGVRDSKQMTPVQRDYWAVRIREAAVSWGVGFASAEEIDILGIVSATRLAVQRAIDTLPVSPQHLLLDYLLLPESPLPQTALIKGDCRSLSIAAASVLAKTARDALMRGLDIDYPGYGFAIHKGYGTAAHRAALAQWGACAIHRKTFRFRSES